MFFGPGLDGTMKISQPKRGRKSHGNTTKHITVRMPVDMAFLLQKAAEINGCSRSALILHIVDEWLKKTGVENHTR